MLEAKTGTYGDVMAGNACMLQLSSLDHLLIFFSAIHLLSAACREGHPLLHLRPGLLGKLEYANPSTADDAMSLLIYSIERAVSMMPVGVTRMGVIGNAIDATVAFTTTTHL